MSSETANALLAGFISGAAAALVTTVVWLLAMTHSAWWRERASTSRALPPSLAGILIANGMLLAWTAAGLVLGALYLRAESSHPAGALGSGNRLFSLLVVGSVLVLLGAAAFVRGRPGAPLWATALVAALAFGWLLPALAG